MRKPKERFLSKYNGKKYGWFLFAKEFVILLIALAILFNLLIGISRVTGQSMEPTLVEGEIVLFSRFNLSYDRGDVVMVHMPSGEYYVKRIVALPGDIVTLENGCLYVNGQPQQTGQGDTWEQSGIVTYPYTVEPDKYFLVGDNREHSTDSRTFGALPKSSIQGKILFH